MKLKKNIKLIFISIIECLIVLLIWARFMAFEYDGKGILIISTIITADIIKWLTIRTKKIL